MTSFFFTNITFGFGVKSKFIYSLPPFELKLCGNYASYCARSNKLTNLLLTIRMTSLLIGKFYLCTQLKFVNF